MEAEAQVKNLFNLCEQLYVFCRRNVVVNTYGGDLIKRLLVLRWTGHYQSVLVVKNNRDEILQTLKIVANTEKAPSDVSVDVAGLLSKVSKLEFNFFKNAINKILALLSLANSLLQGRSCNSSLAVELISTAKQNILAMRSEEVFGEIADATGFPADAESL